MSSSIDQQPIARTVGQRRPPDGRPLTAADRLRWIVDAMVQARR